MFRFLNLCNLANQEQNMFGLGVRHCSRLYRSRFKNCNAAEWRRKFLWSSINRESGSTDWKSQIANFKSGLKLAKCLGFEWNTSRYKRKTLTTFYKFLEVLWVTLVRFERFLPLLTQKAFVGTRYTIKN